MNDQDFRLATLDEAAPSLARLRAALVGEGGAVEAPPPPEVLAFVRGNPGAILHEVAAATSLPIGEVETQLRALARMGLVQTAAGEDGVARWWPVVEAP